MNEREKVLALLQKNARLSAVEIAERLAMDAAAVEAIISECEAGRVIRGYYALVSEEAVGRDRVRAIIEVSIQPERNTGFDRIARNVSRFPEVRDVTLVSGNYDLQLIVEGDRLQDVADFVSSRLSPLDGIRSTRTHFILKKYKEAGFTYHDDEEHERLRVSP